MQLLGVVSGLDAQVVVQEPTQTSIGDERLALPTGAVEGQHPGAVQTLAVGMLRHEIGELGDELSRTAVRELVCDALLRCLGTLLIQSHRSMANQVAVHVGEGGSAP